VLEGVLPLGERMRLVEALRHLQGGHTVAQFLLQELL
jgi:hypothetical protein